MCDDDKAGFRNDQPINETNGNERNCCSWRVGTKILPKYVFFKVHNIETIVMKECRNKVREV